MVASDHPNLSPTPPSSPALESPPDDHFPWEFLPITIQEFILSLLPISTLIVLTSVSRSLRSTTRSPSFLSEAASLRRRHLAPADLLFLPFSFPSTTTTIPAFNPSTNRWLSLPFRSCYPVASSSSVLAIKDSNDHFSFFNPFSNSLIPLPPSIPMPSPYALALFDEKPQSTPSPQHHHLLVVSTHDRIRSQLYSPSSNSWKLTAELPDQFALLDTAVFLDPLLFVLARMQDRILCFDPRDGSWSFLDVAIPDVFCVHILGFDGRLFMIGTMEEVAIVRIGIWEYNGSDKKWVLVEFMPEEFFEQFQGCWLYRFDVMDRLGKIYFHNSRSPMDLIYDLPEKRWWFPAPCPVSEDTRFWLGHALEPTLDLLTR